MIAIVFTVWLYGAAAIMLLIAWRWNDGTAQTGLKDGVFDFLRVVPRLAAGILGAGYLARTLPQETIIAWIGPDSALPGLALASLAGALTPGGAVVGFALGTAALKAGAGLPQVVAYVTGWSLFTINRMLIWELPYLPKRFIALRVIASLPVPFIAAGLVILLLRIKS